MIPASIRRILVKKNWTVGTAESLTAGLISATLASQSGSSAYLRGGIVAYTLEAKVTMLGVNREDAARCNCVSAEVTLQMALGAKKLLGTECVIAVTGYAEPPHPLYHAGSLPVSEWAAGNQAARGHALTHRGPFAHYVVLCGEKQSTGVIQGGMRSRNAVRRLVTNTTLKELAMLLESHA